MEYIKISGTDLNVSNIVLGCIDVQDLPALKIM